MVRLTRTVRFAINPPGVPDTPGPNTYAGSPPFRGLARYYEVDVTCAGEPDATTGYLLDIKDIDRAVRSVAVPAIARACERSPDADPASVLSALLEPLARALPANLDHVVWKLTPYHRIEMSPSAPASVLVRQRFDFSAAHRLHAPTLSDAENRARFGKCNNPEGHGHNYQVEPCVRTPLAPDGPALTLDRLERIVDETLIRRFDHRHLNRDVPEFAPGTGVIPTVENIARVCHDLLAQRLAREAPDCALVSVTVWETDRTCATYPA
jgi:6-pyruvoyltetrahydropterin/6-carboxytetrahydropterin synthase